MQRLLELWDRLPVNVQDVTITAGLLVPIVLIGLILTFGHNHRALVVSLLWRYRTVNFLFIALISVSVGIGTALVAQERALRQGSANAADKFDLVVTAPGSEITMMLATVYLQPSNTPLLSGELLTELGTHEHVEFAAPLAFGDSFQDVPIVGTSVELVRHLSGELAAGRLFERNFEAIAGSKVLLDVGDEFAVTHGQPELSLADTQSHLTHHGEWHVVGRLPPTGSPWDRALLVPIETIWQVHGMGSGHAPGKEKVGPPYDVRYFPGTPAIVVHAKNLAAYYGLQAEFTRAESMAFFPGTVLSRLHAVLGDMRQVMSVLAALTQILVAVAVLVGLIILMRLFARRLALLRALGAPSRFIVAVVWCFTATLLIVGTLLGLLVGYFCAGIISNIISERTDIRVVASLSWSELHLAATFLCIATMLGLLPALLTLRRSVVDELRA